MNDDSFTAILCAHVAYDVYFGGSVVVVLRLYIFGQAGLFLRAADLHLVSKKSIKYGQDKKNLT